MPLKTRKRKTEKGVPSTFSFFDVPQINLIYLTNLVFTKKDMNRPKEEP